MLLTRLAALICASLFITLVGQLIRDARCEPGSPTTPRQVMGGVGRRIEQKLEQKLDSIPECDLDILRLPDTFMPHLYQVNITTYLNGLKLKGTVEIVTRFGQRQSSGQKLCSLFNDLTSCLLLGKGDEDDSGFNGKWIVLHVGTNIDLETVSVFKTKNYIAEEPASSNKDPARILSKNLFHKACYDTSNQMLAVMMKRRAQPGEEYNIRIEYKSQINDANSNSTAGLYVGQHSEALGSVYSDLHTDFFPANARSVFPCFDEPSFKARFELEITHERNLKAISNSRVERSDVHYNGMIRTKFETTPLMSTHNLAFAVGQYDQVVCSSRTNVVAHVPQGLGSPQDAQFMLDGICDAIVESEAYFGEVRFPSAKLDIVVTKQARDLDLGRGTLGLIVVNADEVLLTKEQNVLDKTLAIKQAINKLASRVVLNQWFGGLVTPKWWDDSWIFDGFSKWQSYWLTEELHPQFSHEANYLLQLQSPMLDAQAATKNVRPIKRYELLDANQAVATSNGASSDKAAAIYQMLDSIDGVSFRKALVDFLKSHSSSSANERDFIGALRSVIGWEFDVESMLRSWLDQAGVPLVEVTYSKEDNRLRLTQSRLMNQTTNGRNVAQDSSWVIPIEVSTHKGVNQTLIMSTRELELHSEIEIDPLNPEHYLKINPGFKSPYRVRYSKELLNRLEGPIRSGQLSPADRFNIIDDMRALLRLGYIEIDEFVKVLRWYERENDGLVLNGLVDALLVLDEARRKHDKDPRDRSREICFYLFDHLIRDYRFERLGDNNVDITGRIRALAALLSHEHEATLVAAEQSFASPQNSARLSRLLVYLDSTKTEHDRHRLAMTVLSTLINERTERIRVHQ